MRGVDRTKHRFCMRGGIVPPSKLIVKSVPPPNGGFIIKGGDYVY